MDRRRESKRKSMYKKTARVNLYDPSPKRPKDELRPTPAAKTQEINVRKAQKMMSATKKFPVLPHFFNPQKT